jgi:hypothetical protein
MTQETELPDVGTRVVLATEVDRYPDAMIPEGRSGTVTSADEERIVVTLDEPQPGLEEWRNELHWTRGIDTAEGQSVAEAFWSEVRPQSPAPMP